VYFELDMLPIGPEYGFWTWVTPTEYIGVFALDPQPMCSEYELETW